MSACANVSAPDMHQQDLQNPDYKLYGASRVVKLANDMDELPRQPQRRSILNAQMPAIIIFLVTAVSIRPQHSSEPNAIRLFAIHKHCRGSIPNLEPESFLSSFPITAYLCPATHIAATLVYLTVRFYPWV